MKISNVLDSITCWRNYLLTISIGREESITHIARSTWTDSHVTSHSWLRCSVQRSTSRPLMEKKNWLPTRLFNFKELILRQGLLEVKSGNVFLMDYSYIVISTTVFQETLSFVFITVIFNLLNGEIDFRITVNNIISSQASLESRLCYYITHMMYIL